MKRMNEQFGVDFKDTFDWVKKKHPQKSDEEQRKFAWNIINKKKREETSIVKQDDKVSTMQEKIDVCNKQIKIIEDSLLKIKQEYFKNERMLDEDDVWWTCQDNPFSETVEYWNYRENEDTLDHEDELLQSLHIDYVYYGALNWALECRGYGSGAAARGFNATNVYGLWWMYTKDIQWAIDEIVRVVFGIDKLRKFVNEYSTESVEKCRELGKKYYDFWHKDKATNENKNNRMRKNNKALYESIMRKVAKVVKKSLNEECDYCNMSISHGSLHPYDIVKAELNFLFHHFKEDYRKFFRTADFDYEFPLALDDRNDPYWESDDTQNVLDQLEQIMDSHSPEGYMYCAHEGDGSDFGYWQCFENKKSNKPMRSRKNGIARLNESVKRLNRR